MGKWSGLYCLTYGVDLDIARREAIIMDSLGACKGEHGGLCLRVQKVRDTGMGDPVVGFWLGVQK